MLLNDCRPKLYCKGVEVQNLSLDSKVLFLEEDHLYFSADDIIDGKILPFEDSKYKFKSPTGLLKNFKEEFDTIPQAKKYVKRHNLDITWQQLVKQWEDKGLKASTEGTLLHGYAESIFNNWGMTAPGTGKDKFVEELVAVLLEDYTLVRTELLVFSTLLKIAGQVDLLLKHRKTGALALMDYKFIKAPLERKSYYNKYTYQYKMMTGPFRKLFDTAYFHYSIQMAIYQYLMGAVGKRITSRTLLVVTPEEYILDKGWPIKVWCDKEGYIQAAYKEPRGGKVFNSAKDEYYMKNKVKFY